MLWLLMVLAILVIIVIIVLFLRIYITVQYSFKDREQEVYVSVSLARLRLLHKKIPLSKFEDSFLMEEIDETVEQLPLDSMMKKARKGLEAFHHILLNVKLHQLKWSTFIGTGEASSTGVASGMLWSLKGTIVGYFVEKLILMCQPTIQVNPRFQQAYFQTNLDCMVSIRIGKAIQGFVKLTRIMKAK